MQDEFLRIYYDTKNTYANLPESEVLQHMKSVMSKHADLIHALLKIRTDKVDILSRITQKMEEDYLLEVDSPNKKFEAKIYGIIMANIHLEYLDNDTFNYTELVNRTITNIYSYIVRES